MKPLLKFMASIPAATLFYISLIAFSKTGFTAGWLGIAILIDIVDWMISSAS